MAQHSPIRSERATVVRLLAPQKSTVPSRGKPDMMWHRSQSSLALSHSAPPWSLRSDLGSSDLENKLYTSHHCRHHLKRRQCGQELGQAPLMGPWPAQWQLQVQWPFWTLGLPSGPRVLLQRLPLPRLGSTFPHHNQGAIGHYTALRLAPRWRQKQAP